MQLPQPPGINVDPSTLDDIKCDKCQDLRFQQVVLIKRVPKLISPTGQEGLAPIPVFACLNCGWVNSQFLPPGFRKEATTEPANTLVAETTPADATKTPSKKEKASKA